MGNVPRCSSAFAWKRIERGLLYPPVDHHRSPADGSCHGRHL